MPRALGPIPNGVAFVDKDGGLTEYGLLRWQELIDGFQGNPLLGSFQQIGNNANLAAKSIYLTKAAGLYRLSYYMRKLVADGVNSSLTVTVGWTESGAPQTHVFAALTLDTAAANQSDNWTVWADENTDLTLAIAYASNTPGQMKYRVDAMAEGLT